MDIWIWGFIAGYVFYPLWHRLVVNPVERYFRNKRLARESAEFAHYVQEHPKEFEGIQSFNNIDLSVKVITDDKPVEEKQEAN